MRTHKEFEIEEVAGRCRRLVKSAQTSGCCLLCYTIFSLEAEKENKRMFALEDRVDDEFDEARIDDGVKSYLEYEKQKNKKGNKNEK